MIRYSLNEEKFVKSVFHVF